MYLKDKSLNFAIALYSDTDNSWMAIPPELGTLETVEQNYVDRRPEGEKILG